MNTYKAEYPLGVYHEPATRGTKVSTGCNQTLLGFVRSWWRWVIKTLGKSGFELKRVFFALHIFPYLMETSISLPLFIGKSPTPYSRHRVTLLTDKCQLAQSSFATTSFHLTKSQLDSPAMWDPFFLYLGCMTQRIFDANFCVMPREDAWQRHLIADDAAFFIRTWGRMPWECDSHWFLSEGGSRKKPKDISPWSFFQKEKYLFCAVDSTILYLRTWV